MAVFLLRRNVTLSNQFYFGHSYTNLVSEQKLFIFQWTLGRIDRYIWIWISYLDFALVIMQVNTNKIATSKKILTCCKSLVVCKLSKKDWKEKKMGKTASRDCGEYKWRWQACKLLALIENEHLLSSNTMWLKDFWKSMLNSTGTLKNNILYACHNKPWLVYFLPHFSLRFIFKSG